MRIVDTTEISSPDGRYFRAYKRLPGSRRKHLTKTFWSELRALVVVTSRADAGVLPEAHVNFSRIVPSVHERDAGFNFSPHRRRLLYASIAAFLSPVNVLGGMRGSW